MKITQIRNATIIIEYEGTKFLIDPWLMPKEYMSGFDTAINSHIRQPRIELPFEIEKIVDVDAVIVTHIHPDHWDEFAENNLGKNIKIFVQSEFDKNYLLAKGFRNIEILFNDGNEFNNIKLYKTLGQHGKREIVEPICKSINMPYDAMGVIFKSQNEKTLYLVGDSIWCEEVKVTLEKFKPEIIIVNACEATVLNGEKLIMGINDIKEIINISKKSKIIASHMDTVSHLALTREELRNFKNTNQIDNLLIPNDGETLIFN